MSLYQTLRFFSVSFAVIKCLIRTVDAVLYPVRFLVGVKSQSQRAGEFPVRMVDPECLHFLSDTLTDLKSLLLRDSEKYNEKLLPPTG